MKKLIFILLFISPALFGQIYYISPSGNDVTGDGSSGSPWRSLYKATSEVTTAGSLIFVREGIYTETSQSQLAAQVNLEGTGVGSIITSTTLTSDPILKLESAVEGGIGNQTISNLYFDGADTTAFSAIHVIARSNVTIHHCTFVNFLQNGVLFAGRVTSSSQLPPDVYSENNKFHHNTMLNCSYDRLGLWGWSIYLATGALTVAGQKDMIIENNIIDNTTSNRNGYGINTIARYLGSGNNMGLKIRKNTIKVNQAYRTDAAQTDFAIELWTSHGGVDIIDNDIAGGVNIAGYDSDDSGGYGYLAKIHENRLVWNTPSAHETVAMVLESGLTGGMTIMRNYIKNYSTAIAFYQKATNPPTANNYIVEDITIAYNVFHEIRRVGSSSTFLTEFLNSGAKAYYSNISFLNNTTYTEDNESTLYGFYSYNGSESAIKKEFTNLRIENNIFAGWRYSIVLQHQIIDGLTIKNNILYNNYYNTYSFTGSDISNNDTENGIVANPLFVNAGAGNFELQSGSPAINAGINVGLDKDFRGWPIVGLPDIGAYEYGATAPAAGGMLIDQSGVLLRSDGGTLMRVE